MDISPREIFAFLFFILILSLVFYTNLIPVVYHGDEGGWITSGVLYYQMFFIDRQFDPVEWYYSNPGKYAFGAMNPPVAKYFIGWSVNDLVGEDFNYFYAFTNDRDWNYEHGRMPPENVLSSARGIALVFSFLALLLYWISLRRLFDYRVALVSCLLVLFNTQFLKNARRVMTEPFFFFFWAITLFLIVFFYVRKDRIRLVYLFFAGIAAGLCFSSKLLGAFFLMVVLTILFLDTIHSKEYIGLLCKTILFLASFSLVFILVNPLFYPCDCPNIGSVPERLISMIVYWMQRFPSENMGIVDRLGFMFINNSTMFIDGLIGLAGFIYLSNILYRKRDLQHIRVIALVLFFYSILLGFFMQLKFLRWHLFMHWAISPLAGYMIVELIDKVRNHRG